MPAADFKRWAFKELTLNADTAVAGALFDRVETAAGKFMMVSSFLFDMTKINDEWLLYSRYKPAPVRCTHTHTHKPCTRTRTLA